MEMIVFALPGNEDLTEKIAGHLQAEKHEARQTI